MVKYRYKLIFYSIKKNTDEVKLFDNYGDFIKTYNLLLGHTNIKDLKAFTYNVVAHRYIQVFL